MAFLTLFRVATGDNWNGIMKVSSTKAYFPEVHYQQYFTLGLINFNDFEIDALSTGPLACLFAPSLAPLTHLLALHC